MPEAAKGPTRKATDVMEDIEKKLATIDGIAMSDAFALGRLVQEYGLAMRVEGAGEFMGPIMEALLKSREKPDEPWKPGFGIPPIR